MTNQVNQYERHMAIQEAYQIHDSDEYFKARPQLECGDRRKVFYAGHIRGYQAATQASEQRITELQELLNDRQSDLDFEFNRAEQNELDCNSLKERVEELQADNNQLREALELARKEYEGLPHSLGYEFTHLPIINKALSSTPENKIE